MCKDCEDENDYIDNHGFGISSRLLESDEPLMVELKWDNWKDYLFNIKLLGVDYNNLLWYQKLALKLDFLLSRFNK